MKKILVRVSIVLVVLVVGALVVLSLFLDHAVKKGVETLGPKLTKVSVTLDRVNLSVLSGSGGIEGLVLGNPDGYKTPSAMKLGRAHVVLQPSSVLGNKIVIRSIVVEGAEVTFEGDLRGNNLSQIQQNVEAATGGAGATAAGAEADGAGASRALQVDEFVFAGAKVTVNSPLVAGRSITLNLPDIRLQQLGQGPEGITASDLTRVLVTQITKETVAAVGKELTRVGGEVVEGATKAGQDALNQGGQAVKGVTDLFKKKK